MANTYKNIVVTPNRSTAANVVPSIQFSGGDATTNTDINLKVYTTSNGTLSFEGSAGQLFSITNDLSNVIFSVNDVSGIPSIEVDANGRVSLAQFSGNVGIGTASPTFKLDVSGDMRVTGNVILGDASTDTITLNGSVITLGNNQSFDSGTLFIDAVNNEVGIGITNPTSNLHVIGTANISGSLIVLGSNVTQAFISGNAYTDIVAGAAFTRANAANQLASNVSVTAVGAFAKANAALANTTGTFSGDLSVTGLLRLLAAGGDEGGEMRLEKPPNGTLAGGVVIDAHQNKIRIFEDGGTNRGVFINLSVASASVGTDLLSGTGGIDAEARTTAAAAFNKANAANVLAFNALPNTNGAIFNGSFRATANVEADRFISNNNGLGENYKVGDDAWIGDTNIANAFRVKGQQNTQHGYISFGTADSKTFGRKGTEDLTWDANTIWTAGNDGAGSGLDADLLDGQQGTFYSTASYATAAFNAANAAPGIANTYATAVGTSGNTFASSVGVAANTYATSVGTSSNAYATLVGSSANARANVVGTSANAYATSVGTSDNAYALATATAVGTAGNTFASSVGVSANTFATAVGVAGNSYATAVGTSSNAYATAVGAAGNTYTLAAFNRANTALQNTSGTVFSGTLPITDNVLIGRTTSTVGQNVRLDVNGGINASILLASTNVSIGNANPQSAFVIDRPGGSNPNFVMQGDGEQTFRFLNSNTTVGAPTRVSWKLANRYNTDWQFIWYTDVAYNGANDIVLQARTGAVTKTLFYGNVETGIVGIGRTTSTVGQNVLLDVAGAVNASAVLVNGTPLTSGGASVYSANVGNNSANTFTINHALNKSFVVPAVRERVTGYYAYPDIRFVDANNIVLEFIDPPTTNAYVVIVLG
jgi:hypothetical protein